MARTFMLGFHSLSNQVSDLSLACRGVIPDWLHGSLIRNGPAQFAINAQAMQHWFDGYAMLHRFHFADQKITYTNRFIQSEAYTRAQHHHCICLPEFATQPQVNIFQKVLNVLNAPTTDNTNVNVTMIAGDLVAMTETTRAIVLDAETLSTQGPFKFDDELPGVITTAHPQYDFKRNELYNFTTSLGAKCYYHIYRIAQASKQRQLIASVPVTAPAYMHSFAMTDDYFILIEPPLRLKLWPLLLASKPYIEAFVWQPQQGTVFTVIDKSTGAVLLRVTTEAFFAFHQLNAYQQGNEIVLDLAAFDDNTIVSELYLTHLAQLQQPLSQALPTRYHINLLHKTISKQVLSDCYIELPRIHYQAHHMRSYQFVYGISKNADSVDFLNQIIKLDVVSGRCHRWQQPDCYAGEPVFVANPNAHAEDDGILLSLVLDSKQQRSFLLVLDAASLMELARAHLPHAVPFGFHGQFYSNSSPT